MNESVASQKTRRNLRRKVLKGLRKQNRKQLVDLCE